MDQRDQPEDWQYQTRPFPRSPDMECELLPRQPVYRPHIPNIDHMEKTPDPWGMEIQSRHPYIPTKAIFISKMKNLIQWANYLGVHHRVIMTIRDRMNALSVMIETRGPSTPTSEIKLFAAFISANWPKQIPRGEDGIKKVPTGARCRAVIRTYQLNIDEDLSAASGMVGLNRWTTRRSKFETFSKFAVLINQLAREIGPPAYAWVKNLQLKLDVILSMRAFTFTPEVIGDYSTNFNDWVAEMMAVEPVYKCVGGTMVEIVPRRVTISEPDYTALMNKREAMDDFPPLVGPGIDSDSDDSDDEGSSYGQLGPNAQLSVSSHDTSSGVWSGSSDIEMGN
jgi:hypothetical protein